MRQTKYQLELERHARCLHDVSQRRVTITFLPSTQLGIMGRWEVQLAKDLCPEGVIDVRVTGSDLIACLTATQRARVEE